MFWTENTNENQETKKREVTVQEALGIAAVVLGIVAYQKIWLIERFYRRNFEEIYLIAAGLVIALALFTVRQMKKRAKSFETRTQILEQVWDQSDGILAGQTDDGVCIHVPEETRTGHAQILGATGKGKTKSVIEAWLSRDLSNGRNIILIDGKGDPKIVEHIRPVAQARGADHCLFEVFDLGNPEKSCACNPLENGSAQQIADRIFTAFEFNDPYYKAVQYDIAGSIVRLIQEIDFYEYHAPKEYKKYPGIVTFRRLYELITSDEALAKAVSESTDGKLVSKFTDYLKTPKDQRTKQLSGLISQIGPFAQGEVAELVNGGSNEQPRKSRNVSDLVVGERYRQIVYVILIPTLKYQQIGHQLGKLLLQELGWAVGERASQTGGNCPFVPVYLDEFSSFVYPGFTNILNKARSSNVALHLSHQSLGDLGQVSPDFAKIINTNTNIKCIFGLNDPETADWMARHLGTETGEKVTERAQENGLWAGKTRTGELSIREVESYKVHPNTLKNFGNGRGVIHMPTSKGNLTEEIQFTPFSLRELTQEDF